MNIIKNILIVAVILFILLIVPPIIGALSNLLGLISNPISTVIGWVGRTLKNNDITEAADNIRENKNVAANALGVILIVVAVVVPVIPPIVRIALGFVGLLLIRDGVTNLINGGAVREAVKSGLDSLLGSDTPAVTAAVAKIKDAPLASYFN